MIPWQNPKRKNNETWIMDSFEKNLKWKSALRDTICWDGLREEEGKLKPSNPGVRPQPKVVWWFGDKNILNLMWCRGLQTHAEHWPRDLAMKFLTFPGMSNHIMRQHGITQRPCPGSKLWQMTWTLIAHAQSKLNKPSPNLLLWFRTR